LRASPNEKIGSNNQLSRLNIIVMTTLLLFIFATNHFDKIVALLGPQSFWLWLVETTAIILAASAMAFGCWRFTVRREQCWPGPPKGNGIGVDRPKLYDTRSLTLMLEEMQEQLRRLNGISEKQITDAQGTVQGQRSSSTEFTVDATIAKGSGATSSANSQREPKSDAAKSGAQQQPADEKKTAPPPAPSTVRSSDAPRTNSQPSERPTDLLTDQVNLTYDLLNLRLLLERALSDRIFDGDKPRLQAVFGFPLSVNTPEFATGCCANIEITIEADVGTAPPSLVALLPQEKSYNTIVGRRRAGSLGLSGPVKLFTLGFRGGTQRDESYLERDSDTVALLGEVRKGEGCIPESKLRFGWQLRPMAGHRSVTAGLRQMFAVLALPQKDESASDKLSLNIEIRTYWRRFNARTGTSSDRLNLKAWISNRPVEVVHTWTKHFEVNSTEIIEKGLRPYLESVSWQAVGNDRAVIMVKGSNFFPGTSVLLGNQAYRTAEDGLVIKSERTLQVTVPLVALMNDAVLNGRYGPSQSLFLAPADLPFLEIKSVHLLNLNDSTVSEMRIEFSIVENQRSLDEAKFMALPDPLLMVNQQLLSAPLTFSLIKSPDGKVTRVDCVTLIPSSLVPDGNCSIVLKFPIFGPQWTFPFQLYSQTSPDLTVNRIRKLGHSSLLISGTRFVPKDVSTATIDNNSGAMPPKVSPDASKQKQSAADWKVRLDREYIVGVDNELQRLRANLLELTVPESVLDANDTLIILPPGEQQAIVMHVPRIPPPIRVPMFSPAAQALLVTANAAATVMPITGAFLDLITKAQWDDIDVDSAAAAGGQTLNVALKPGMASAVGRHQLTLSDVAGGTYSFQVLVTESQN
jgi:hypothetical protein